MRNKMKGGVRLENSQKSSLIASKSKMAARVAIFDQDAILKYFQLFLILAHIVIGFCIPQNPYIPNFTLSYRSAALFYISIPLYYAIIIIELSKIVTYIENLYI